MSYRNLGKPISTAEMGTTTVRQKITTGDKKILLKAIHAGVIFYNDPQFNNLYLRIYADSGGSPGSLLATSKAWLKADLLTLDNACKSIGFVFDNAVPLNAATDYYLVLYATAYTGDLTSHLAWRLSYPNPQYTEGLDLDAAHADNHPFEISLIGTDL